MTHDRIFKAFELYLKPVMECDFVMWFPNGRSSIRLRKKNGQEFVFTYHSPKDWRFETIDSFIKTMNKKEKKP